MDFKKLLLATVAAFLVMFFFDYLWYMGIPSIKEIFHMGENAGDSVPTHALGVLSLALLMAYVFPIGFKGGSAINEGIKFGILIGLLIALPSALHQRASHEASLHSMLGFVINGVLSCSLGGILIAMMYGGNKK